MGVTVELFEVYEVPVFDLVEDDDRDRLEDV